MPALLALLLAARLTGSVGVSTEGRAGRAAEAQATELGGAVQGVVHLSFADGTLSGNLTWAPRLSWLSGLAVSDSTWLQSAAGGLLLRLSPRQSLSLTQGFALGTRDYSPLLRAPDALLAPPIDRLPEVRTVFVLDSTTSLDWAYSPGPSLSLGLNAAYSNTGGWGAEARTVLPRQQAISGALSGSLRLDARDALSLYLNSSRGLNATGTASQAIGMGLSLNHVFDARTSGQLGLGAAVVLTRSDSSAGSTPSTLAIPTGRVALSHTTSLRGRRLALGLSGQTAPAFDPLSGAGYLRASLGLDANYVPTGTLAFALGVSGARALLGGREGDWGGFADLSASVSLVRDLRVNVGFRGGWTPLPVLDVASQPLGARPVGFSWTLFIGLGAGYSRRL